MRWRLKANCGAHHFYEPELPKVVRPGDIVNCTRERLRGAVYKFEALDPEPPTPLEAAPSDGLMVRERPDGDGYDVFNQTTGRALNSLPLTQEAAEAILWDIGASQGYEYAEKPPGYAKPTVIRMERAT